MLFYILYFIRPVERRAPAAYIQREIATCMEMHRTYTWLRKLTIGHVITGLLYIDENTRILEFIWGSILNRYI
jgi:hypothetical protein